MFLILRWPVLSCSIDKKLSNDMAVQEGDSPQGVSCRNVPECFNKLKLRRSFCLDEIQMRML